MEILRIEDPRDNLEKARRKELEMFARQKGVTEIDPRMPATIMRKILRQKGLTDIQIPKRVLGQNPGAAVDPVIAGGQPAHEVDAVSDLVRQWKEEATRPAHTPEPQSIERMSIAQLRMACREAGVKLARTDSGETIRKKLRAARNGEDAA